MASYSDKVVNLGTKTTSGANVNFTYSASEINSAINSAGIPSNCRVSRVVVVFRGAKSTSLLTGGDADITMSISGYSKTHTDVVANNGTNDNFSSEDVVCSSDNIKGYLQSNGRFSNDLNFSMSKGASSTYWRCEASLRVDYVTYSTITVGIKNNIGGSISSTGGSYYTGDTFSVSATSSPGYVFSGWADSNGNITTTANPYSFTVSGNTTFYAVFTPKTYTVTFNANGGTTPTASKTVTYNSTYGTLPTPTRSGYIFDDWYTATSGGTKITSSTTVQITSNQTLYAQWKAIPDINYENLFSLSNWINSASSTLNSNGNSNYDIECDNINGSIKIIDLPGGSTDTYTPHAGDGIYVIPVEKNQVYIFKYNVETNGSARPMIFSTNDALNNFSGISLDVVTGSGIYEYEFTPTTNYIHLRFGTVNTDNIYAKFSNIQIYKKSRQTEVSKLSKIRDLKTLSSLYSPSIEGYTFDGWYKEEGLSNKVDLSWAQSVTKGETVYSKWITHRILFNYYANNGNTTPFITWNAEASQAWPDNHYNYSPGQTYEQTKIGYSPTPYKDSTGIVSDGSYGTTPSGGIIVGQDENFNSYKELCERYGIAVTTQSTTISIYAQWTPNNYVVQFDANSGTVSITNKTITYDSKYGELPIPIKTGYTFDGWYTEKSGGNKIIADTIVKTANDHTLYAHWIENKYTIAFNGNGATSGSTNSMTNIGYDDEVTLTINSFVRIGYVFSHWNTKSDDSGTKYTNEQTGILKLSATNGATITLYAIWKANEYIISFDSNTGTGSMSDLSMVYDIQKKLPKNIFTKTGYTFQGWSTNKNATSATYSDEQSVKNLTSAVDGKVTLYAIWKANEYIIKYNGNGHTGGSTADSVHTYDIVKSLNNNGFKKEYTVTYLPMGGQCSIDSSLAAYTFKEWRTNADGSGDRFLNGQEVLNLTSQLNTFINLYTQWTETSIILPVATRTGYTFDGWYTTDNKFIGMNGESYIPKTNIVLEAHWIEHTYNIQFYGNGETNGNTESMLDIGYDEYTQLNKNGFIKTGYHFTTWNTSIDGSGESYTDEQYIKNLSDKDKSIVKLYAQWEPNKYKVQFNANGGEGTMNDQEHIYDSELALSKNQFKRIGYTFLGWAIHKNATVPNFVDEEIVENLVTGNTTILYAVWQVHTYTISFDDNGATSGEMTMILDAIYDVPLPLPNNEFKKIGHEFLGWSRNPEDIEIEIEDCGNAFKLTSDDKGHVILYAIWVQQFYDITWKRVNNGKDLVVSTPGGTIPQCPIFPFIEPDSEKHYIFVRWNRTILVADRPTEYTAIYEVGKHSYTIREVTEPVGDYWGYTTHICDEKTCNHSYIDSYRWRVIFRDENENILYNKKVPPETKIFPPSYIRKEEEYDDAEKNYYFDGWYEVNSGEKWYTNKVADTNLIYDATYEWKIQEYPVKWYDGDGNLIDSKILQYGEKPETDIIPTKANDGYNSYVFDGWSYEGVDNEGTVAGPVNCYAQFIATTLSYTVTWKNIDGTTLHQEVGFEYKEKSPEYPYSTPIHPRDEEDLAYDYEFVGWRSNVQNKFYPEGEDLPPITSDIIYTAVYKKIPTEYSIKVHILRLDESICLSYENLRYNETIYIDAHYYGSPRGYTFKQWNDGNETIKRTITVKGNAEYVAEYERNTYTVKWLDYNDKTIDIKELKYKTIPNHKEIEGSYNFTKPYDDKYHYDFYGDWKLIRGDVTKKDEILGNVVYKTIYQEELHTWTEPEFNFYIPIKEASAKRHCTHCGHFEEARVRLEKHILEGEEATCDKPGKITYIAPFYHSWNKLDGPRTLKVDVPALGHIWSAAKKLGEDGEFGYHCRVCNRCNTAEIEEHIWDDGRVTTYGACIYGGTIKHKCTAPGCTALYYEKVIPGNHGDFIETAAIPETCEEYGHKGYKQCTVCKLYFPIDVDANTVYGNYNIDPFIIKPKGHNYNQEVVDVKANCVVNGWKRLICANNCGIDKVIEIKPRGHNFKEIETIYDSDKPCKYPSIKKYQCQNHLNEGEEIYYQNCAEEEIANAPLVPHTPVVIKGTPPTCTEKGESNGKECAVCKDILLEKHELPPLGHHMISKSLVPAENTLRREVMNTCVRKGCNYKIHLYYSD